MERLTIDEIIKHCDRKTEMYEKACDIKYLETTDMNNSIKEYWEHKQVAEYLKQLKEYQQLEEQGRLIKLPCKIGDTIYNTTWWDNIQEKVIVKGKTYYRTIPKHKVSKSIFSYSDINEFGKTVFLTKKEAEEKLKELNNEENTDLYSRLMNKIDTLTKNNDCI